MSSQRSSQTDVSSAVIPAIILFGGLTLLLLGLLASRPNLTPDKTEVVASPTGISAAAGATDMPVSVAMALDPQKVKAGENTFQTTCSACHGFNAMGIPGLGKTLIGSTFVDDLSDDALLAFLQKGREVTDPANTTGVMMPARGGNPNITDDKLVEVIAYIRSLNMGSTTSVAGAAPTSGSAAVAAVATSAPIVYAPPDLSGLPVPTSNAVSSENANSMSAPTGQALYVQACSGCHGVDGEGVQYLAGPLSASAMLNAKDGIGLLTFLTKAEPPVSPEIQFPHPSRGGALELSDADIQSIMVYLYSLPMSH